MGENWKSLCTEHNKLHPSLLRHCHRVGDKVVKIILQPDERDFYGRLNTQQRILRLRDENSIRAAELIREHTTIPTPKVIDKGEDWVVWEFVNGIDLDECWEKLSERQREGIMHQLKEYIAELWKIPCQNDYAVGTLCCTRELLCDNLHPQHPEIAQAFWTKNGPYRTVEEFHSTGSGLYFEYEPKFPVRVPVDTPGLCEYIYTVSDGLATATPVFDLMDWSKSNIIIHPNMDYVAGIIDWEYAGFIPDPADYFLHGRSQERLAADCWFGLFNGVADMVRKG
jgi:Phosphotransferase enzyme family